MQQDAPRPPVTLEEVREIFARYEPVVGEQGERVRAGVAVVMRDVGVDVEMLLIRRAEREGDPWSGHIAFPGGRIDPVDDGPRAAAERETMEEVNLALRDDEYLGRLDDLTGAGDSVRVSAFLYAIDRDVDLRGNYEVDEVFWVRLRDLLDRDRHLDYEWRWRDTDVTMPAIRVLDGEGPVLWGLTYRFVERFLGIMGQKIPNMPWG
jgi:8-oxo-dGTP pyrophosphatase MutT (NUDIX family)